MSSPFPVTNETFFLDGSHGQLLATYHAPQDAQAVTQTLLHVPAFAEEMNKSRRTVALAARALASHGVASLVVDLFGCGDSAGDFAQARMPIWRQDLQQCFQWLTQKHGVAPGLWGLRLGGLIAYELLARECTSASTLVLWQTMGKGETVMNEFLRLRVAAQMMGTGAEDDTAKDKGGSTKELRAQLEAGANLEIAGYELSGELACALYSLALDPTRPPPCPVHWLEVIREEGRAMLPGSRRIIDAWSAGEAGIDAHPVVGEPFWRTLEIAECTALVDETVACVSA